jgi:hypothetical protein
MGVDDWLFYCGVDAITEVADWTKKGKNGSI